MLEPAIQDKSRWWSREDLLLLVLFGALFFLPGLGQIPLFDRDEPRFATAAREMAVRNDFIVPYFNGNLRPDKPPLVYWLMSAVHQVTGTWSELTVRLPSAICATLTLLVVYGMVGKRFGRVTALIAALLLGSCGTFIAEARLATADATMLLFMVICMACAWTAWETGGGDRDERMPWGTALIFWVSLAAGALAKGVPLVFVPLPMVVLSIATGAMAAHVKQWRSHLHVTRMRMGVALGVGVVASGILAGTMHVAAVELRLWTLVLAVLLIGMALTPGLPGVAWRCVMGGNWRWWKQLRPAWGVPLVVVLIAAWAVPAGMRAPDLLKQMVGIHFLERAAGPVLNWLHIPIHDLARAGGNSAVSNYAQPPGFFTALVWATFWPWSVLLIPAGYFTWRRLRGRTAISVDPRPYQFLVAWILPLWVVLEASRGKLPHYTLPAYVGLAILCADAMVQSWDRKTDVLAAAWFAGVRWLVLAVWCGMGAAVIVGAQRFLEPELFWPCVLLGALFVAAGFAGTIAWNRPSWPFVTVLGWGAALLFMNVVVLPQVGALHLSQRIAARMLELQSKDPAFHLAAVGDSKFPPPSELEGGKWTDLPGYQEGTLVYYTGEHVRMEFPTDRDISVEDLLREIPFEPAKTVGEDQKYLIAVDQPTLEYLQHRTPAITFYPLGQYGGVDSGNWHKVAVTVISNVPVK